MLEMGDHVWSPSDDRVTGANITAYMHWLRERGRPMADYEALRQWSVTDLPGFWRSLVDYFSLFPTSSDDEVIDSRDMPGARWFASAHINYAAYLLSRGADGDMAIIASDESGELREVSWATLRDQVATAATALRAMGVGPEDRVVAYLPNTPETAVAYLATLSIGAVWSSCAPEFGRRSVIDRFSQIAPKVLLVTDSYRFNGAVFGRSEEVADIVDHLPSLEHLIHVPGPERTLRGVRSAVIPWADFMAKPVQYSQLRFAATAFNDPLWIVYSSGTTGLPKPFVHGHGGALLEALKFMSFHMNLKQSSRLFYYTTTGWVMWNILLNGLLCGGSIVMYDGAPMTAENPAVLWDLADRSKLSFFGASPTYIGEQMKRGITPSKGRDLSTIDSILLGGSPVMPEHMAWCLERIHDDIWVTSQSGGTDVASGFVGGCPVLPVYAGEIQCRLLGVDVHAFSDHGEAVIDEVGELVVSAPMPSMPLYLWGDDDGVRYREAYFEEFPGHWRHGDYFKVNARGGCFILGRSDSTLNRYGVRIGTAEVYRTLENLPGIDDCLIVNLTLPDGGFFMPLFVRTSEGQVLDDALRHTIRQTLKTAYSPRHVPDSIIEVPAIPYTLTGKKLEVPVRKILLGAAPEQALSRDAMADPSSLDAFLRVAETRADGAYSI